MLHSVDYVQDAAPLSVRSLVRTGDGDRNEPIIGILGGPSKLGGRILPQIEGARVKARCGEQRFFELITVVRADSRGASLSGMTVTYSVGPREYTLPVDFVYELCGTAVPKRGCR